MRAWVGSLTAAAGLILGFTALDLGRAAAQGVESSAYGGPLIQVPSNVSRSRAVLGLDDPFGQGSTCVRWCVADRSPCDPDYYKVADRRCNLNQSGYF